MNIYDVSKKAGVSIATVSRVINGSSKVRGQTKERVLRVMEELEYTPNAFARSLGLDSMNTVGVLCADSSDLFLANAIYHIERELRRNGYDSFLCCTGYELKDKQKYLELLLSKRVDAVIFIGSHFLEADERANSYIANGALKVPVLLINGYLDRPNIYCTLCDDYQAVFDAVSFLQKRGRKNILFLYTIKSYSTLRKLSGFKEALNACGQQVREDYMKSCSPGIGAVKELLRQFKESGHSFDAILTSEDILAVGAVKYAREQGIAIPEEISIIGYNNSLLANCCEPELSSIDNHVETLSITAVNTLIRVLKGRTVPNKTMISADFIQRSTT